MSGPSERDLVAWSWQNGELSWMLHDAQLVIYEAMQTLPRNVKEVVVLCSRRFGKSYLGVVKAIETCLRSETRKIVRIIGPEVAQTASIVEEAMIKISADLDHLGMGTLIEPVVSQKRYNIRQSSIFIGGFDSQRDNQRGGEAHEIIIEETGSAKPERYSYQMKSVLKPQLLTTRGRMIHMTTLPKENDHPFILETIPQAKMDGAFYSFSIYENPIMDEEMWQDAIKDCGGVDTIDFRREYMNEIVRDESIVAVPTYNDKAHVELREQPLDCIWHVVIDQGGVRDFTVAGLVTYLFDEDIDWCEDVLMWPANTPSSEIIKDLREKWESKYPVIHRISDCPGQTQIDWQRDHQYVVTSPIKGDWQVNLNRLVTRFKMNKWRLHPRTTFLRTSLESGRLTENKKDFARTKALGHCDAIAMLMYANQALDRTCPYPNIQPINTNTQQVIRRPVSEEVDIANALAPKVFGNVRKTFGRY